MVVKVCYARLQVLLSASGHITGGGQLQLPQNPLCCAMLMLEIMTLFITPLLAFFVILVDRGGSTREVLSGMIEVQDLFINMWIEKVPVGSCAIGKPYIVRFRVQRLYMLDLTLHAVEERLFSVLGCSSHIDRVEALTVLV